MKSTDILRELAKIAKSQGNHRLVRIYFDNMKMHRKKDATAANSASR